MPTQHMLPRWRGFNLLDLFTTKSDANFREDDFRWIADWGFDFVRLPMCYLLWTEEGNPYAVREEMLEKIDRAVQLGEKYGLHVSLNFHRAPGYSVNQERQEPFDLWKDQEALDAFCFHWQLFAQRYHGIPSQRVSFDLVNEPPAPSPEGMTREAHARVVHAATAAIRQIDPERLVIMDGLSWGNDPCPELADQEIAQSCRAYMPMGISHYRAPWVGGEQWPEPSWPGLNHDGRYMNRGVLEAHYQQWADLAQQGIGVHCGEGGAFKFTPHPVVLAWFQDVLEILTAHNIGYALWNFRGTFGILDSARADVAYQDWHGHQLDAKFLALLQQF
ncbi:MAG: glycoside hydrolase family 5 protein [Armatimonadota bacterium]